MFKNNKSLVAVRERERELHFNEIKEKTILNRVVKKVRKLAKELNIIKNTNTLIEIARLNL